MNSEPSNTYFKHERRHNESNNMKTFTLRRGKTGCNREQHMNLCTKGHLWLCDFIKNWLQIT